MYAIVEIKGKQYKVEPSSVVAVDLIDAEENSAYENVKVLLHKDDENKTTIGKPFLDNVIVKAEIGQTIRPKKVTSVRYAAKKGYSRTKGHKQKYTALKITGITKT